MTTCKLIASQLQPRALLPRAAKQIPTPGGSLRSAAAQQDSFVLLGRSQEELRQLAISHSQPAYRGKQLWEGLLLGKKRSLGDISTIPKLWREELSQKYTTGRSVVHDDVVARDGTRKLLLRLRDNLVVETVGIPKDADSGSQEGGLSRLTACVSSQVGCPMACTFCATGKGGFSRSLRAHEIVDQVLTVEDVFGSRVSNVVFMGMGEPCLNLTQVWKAVEVLNRDLGIGARHITISSVGVPQTIARLAELPIQVQLAISLHAPNQALRQTLVPSAKAYHLSALMADCVAYFKKTSRRVSFEYTLLEGVNDSVEQAAELAVLLKAHDLAAHVNLIPWNKVDDTSFSRPNREAPRAFAAKLASEGIPVNIRATRGLDAAAACGQLRNQHQRVPLSLAPLPQLAAA